jgi:EF hand
MRLAIPVQISVIMGIAAGLAVTAAHAQQVLSSCDGGSDGSVSAQQSLGGAEQRFDLLRQGANARDEEQFAAALPGADGLRQQFIQADEDGDGRISRDEWLRWFGPAHADRGPDRQPTGPN